MYCTEHGQAHRWSRVLYEHRCGGLSAAQPPKPIRDSRIRVFDVVPYSADNVGAHFKADYWLQSSGIRCETFVPSLGDSASLFPCACAA